MAAHRTSSVATFDDEGDALFLSPEAARELFDADVRLLLGISGEEFLARVRAGEIVDDDADSNLAVLFAMLPYLALDMPGG